MSLPRMIPVFDAAECATFWTRVQLLRKFWIKRHATAPSYTLGAACYLDVPDHGMPEYVRRLVRNNKLLKGRFPEVFERLAQVLERELGAPVAYTDRYALPGFHIFEAGEAVAELKPKLHFDLQDVDLEWDGGNAREDHARVSFTLPVAMPASGAGLRVWDLEVDPNGRAVEPEEAAQIPATDYEYRLGEMFLHTGDRLHQIAAGRATLPGEARVTLQGHARRTRGTWIIYW